MWAVVEIPSQTDPRAPVPERRERTITFCTQNPLSWNLATKSEDHTAFESRVRQKKMHTREALPPAYLL